MDPQEVIDKYAGLVKSSAESIVRRLKLDVPLEDLIGYGYQGLLEAYDRYDESLPVSFSSFAFYRIRGAIYDGCRKEGWAMRGVSIEMRDEIRLNEHLESNFLSHVDVPRPKTLNDSMARLDQMVGDCVVICLVSRVELEGIRQTDEAPQRTKIEQRDLTVGLQNAIERLRPNEREVIVRHHLRGESMSDIADDMECSKSWVCRINARALAKMRQSIYDRRDTPHEFY